MIVSAIKFKNFISRCIVYSRGMTGKRTPYLLDLHLEVENNTLFCAGIDDGKNIQIDFSMSVECDEIKSFYISDSIGFLKFLKDSGLKGKIEVSHSGIYYDGKLLEYELSEIEINSYKYYSTYFDKIIKIDESMKYGMSELLYSVAVKSKDIVAAVKKVNYRYELFEYKFEVVDDKFYVSILSRDGKEFKTEVPAKVISNDCSSVYSIGIDCVFKDLGPDIELHFNNNTPMIVEDEGNQVTFFPVEYLDGE